VLTSPPYFRLRNYDTPTQIGTEPAIGDWVDNLREILAEVARVLVPTGTVWLNLGDAYATHPHQGAGRKSLLLGPERLALVLVQDGWLLRNKIIWHKTNPMPMSVTDRFTSTYEVVYLLTRRPDYFFDLDATRIPHTGHAKPRRQPSVQDDTARGPNAAGTSGLSHLKDLGLPGHRLGKNPGDLWHLATSAYRGKHPAMFPQGLAEHAITAGCPERRCQTCRAPHTRHIMHAIGATATRGNLTPTCDCDADTEPGIVLDPFMGAGTTALAAEHLNRDWLGIELNPDYLNLATQRLHHTRAGPPPHQQDAA